jgi:hypothetical protein
MPAFDPRDRREVRDARGNAGYGGGGTRSGGGFGGGFGGRFGGNRGTLSQQQDRINQASARAHGNIAPGVPEGFVRGMNLATSRRTVNPTTTRPLTPHNLWEAFKAMPMSGIGAVNLLGGALGVPGMGPQYEGQVGMANSPGDYDPSNRFGTTDSRMFRPNVAPVQAAGAAQPSQAPMGGGGLNQMQVPAAQFSIPGPSQYGVNLPSYGYFGQPPAQARPPRTPMSMIMGGI